MRASHDTASAAARPAARAALDHLGALLRLAGKPAWTTPILVTLGLATSLAETLGITLVIAFLYVAVGQASHASAAVGSWLGQGLSTGLSWFGSPERLAAAILLLILLRSALSHANRALGERIGERISETVRNRLHALYLAAPYGDMQRQDQGRLLEVLGTESWLVDAAYRSLTQVVVGACSIGVFVAFLLSLSWPITLTVVAGSIVLSLVARRLRQRAQALGARVKEVREELWVHMLTTVQGLRTLRAYGQERVQHDRFLRSSAQARETSLSLSRLSALLDPLTEVGYLAILCVVLAGAVRAGIGLPTLLAATALLYRLQPHARNVEGNLLYLAQIEPQLRSLLVTLRSHGPVDEAASGHRSLASTHPAIRFEGVTFRYEDRLPPALDCVSFEIPAGHTTALLGPSGAGKTTVINLLLGLYAPESGSIRIDGVQLCELDRGQWLSMLAIAGQDVDLIEGTVLDNIRMADLAASPQAVLEAALAAGVDEFVQPLPEGYDTWVGAQGHRFSGGQRQRLSLARALLRKPRLLILDEATNALDVPLEERVREAIDRHLPGCTRLVISHRDSALHGADHIVRLEAGRVVPALQL